MTFLGCIIQARIGSTRLPGKVLKLLDEKNSQLFYVINQLRFCKNLEKIVVATTDSDEDNEIIKITSQLGITNFRGSTNDVLDRYYQCAKFFNLDPIVRITADNPLIDPELVDCVIKEFKNGEYDYATNFIPRTFPYGTEAEIFSFNALELAWKESKKLSEREHVTPYFYNNLNKFKIKKISYSKNFSHLRWTVDRESD